jgi:hypothetical protein
MLAILVAGLKIGKKLTAILDKPQASSELFFQPLRKKKTSRQ